MSKLNPEHYLAVDSYAEAVSAFHIIAGTILFEFARQQAGTRDIIIRNFVARTDMMVRAVFQLWELRDYQDCWIMHRCLLDRLFHLYHLQDQNEFEVFEAWSFLEQYNAINRVRSDPEFGGRPETKMFDLAPGQKDRARLLSKTPPAWQRPKAEEVAKRLDMRFLYRFGYDFASTHVHPMADDGHQDFFTITGLQPTPEFPDQRYVLSNTLLVGSMIVQQALNAATLVWRALVYDFLEDLRRFLSTGADDYKISALQVAKLVDQDVRLCRMRSTKGGAA